MAVSAAQIDALLPQTQCTRCGYAGCQPYAEAIAAGEAAINRCPPGGDDTIAALARLLGTPVLALDATCGVHAPHRVAVMDAEACIGCRTCEVACALEHSASAAMFQPRLKV